MLGLLADENFNGDIVRALRRRRPEIDLARVQGVGLSGAQDPPILEWASHAGRMVLTHDLKTIPRYAYERVRAGLPIALFAIRSHNPAPGSPGPANGTPLLSSSAPTCHNGG